MVRPRSKAPAAFAAFAALAVMTVMSGCDAAPAAPPSASPSAAVACAPSADRQAGAAPPPLALLTSLPLAWPLGAGMAEILSGAAAEPWQKAAIAQCYDPVPLDALAPAAATAPAPLAGLARAAVIQPRGLSPLDNVVLDDWVRGGGRLLLVLDPALTGDYDLPLGDPRRPVDSALIPPVVARWGLEIAFDETQPDGVSERAMAGVPLPVALAGEISISDPDAARCTLLAQGAAAVCTVGQGQVTLIADAALFEHPELAGKRGARLLAVLAASLD